MTLNRGRMRSKRLFIQRLVVTFSFLILKIHEYHLVKGEGLELPLVSRISVSKMVPITRHKNLQKSFAKEFSISLTNFVNSSFREKRLKTYNPSPISKSNPVLSLRT